LFIRELQIIFNFFCGHFLGHFRACFCCIYTAFWQVQPASREEQQALCYSQAAASAEGWTAVAEGQTKRAKPAQGRANSELRDSPTRPKGGAAPKTAEEKQQQ